MTFIWGSKQNQMHLGKTSKFPHVIHSVSDIKLLKLILTDNFDENAYLYKRRIFSYINHYAICDTVRYNYLNKVMVPRNSLVPPSWLTTLI